MRLSCSWLSTSVLRWRGLTTRRSWVPFPGGEGLSCSTLVYVGLLKAFQRVPQSQTHVQFNIRSLPSATDADEDLDLVLLLLRTDLTVSSLRVLGQERTFLILASYASGLFLLYTLKKVSVALWKRLACKSCDPPAQARPLTFTSSISPVPPPPLGVQLLVTVLFP